MLDLKMRGAAFSACVGQHAAMLVSHPGQHRHLLSRPSKAFRSSPLPLRRLPCFQSHVSRHPSAATPILCQCQHRAVTRGWGRADRWTDSQLVSHHAAHRWAALQHTVPCLRTSSQTRFACVAVHRFTGGPTSVAVVARHGGHRAGPVAHVTAARDAPVQKTGKLRL